VKRVLLALARAWLSLVALFRRASLRATGRLADTNTMAEWKALQSQPDDPLPTYAKPDPSAPYADLIRRVRLYAKDGAKALAPLLDTTAPPQAPFVRHVLLECQATAGSDALASALLDALCLAPIGCVEAIHAAYNSPWTIGPDGEPVEVVVPGTPPVSETSHGEALH
jgi:hypothetical protein